MSDLHVFIAIAACLSFVLTMACVFLISDLKGSLEKNEDKLKLALTYLKLDKEDREDKYRILYEVLEKIKKDVWDSKESTEIKIISINTVFDEIKSGLSELFDQVLRMCNGSENFEQALLEHLSEMQRTMINLFTEEYNCLVEKVRLLENEIKNTLDINSIIAKGDKNEKKWQRLQDAFNFSKRDLNGAE